MTHRRRPAALLLALVLLARVVSADEPAKPQTMATGEPVSMTIAMAGVVVAAAGFGMMLHESGPCYCGPAPGWVLGGVAVVAAGVTLTWLGLRSRTVTIAPVVSPHVVGVVGVIRLPGDKRAFDPRR